MTHSAAYAATAPDQPLTPFSVERRTPTSEDVEIAILFCGVCHSDLHMVRNEWGTTQYPLVPGHEIVGRVTKVGTGVTRFKAGDLVGVGCMVDSCRTCINCHEGLEQFCDGPGGMIQTYNFPDKHSGGLTYGGYSKSIVVYEGFVLKVSEKLNLAGVAPLLCAGITTYSPLRHWKVGKGQKVGIVGLGGLGHMGLKFAHAFGAETVLITTSPGKTDDARRLGADAVVVSRNQSEMDAHRNSFDFILDCVAAPHDIGAYLALLRRDGTVVNIGVPDQPFAVAPSSLIFGRKSLSGSLIGGISETQEMLDFCAENNITADVEVIDMKDVNTAYERMLKSDVKYRFSIDMASLAA